MRKGSSGAVRRLLVGSGGGISKISDLAEPSLEDARDLYQADRIAAFDGTNAISPLRFVSDTLYAAGVVAVTPRSQHQPRARVTRTRASSYAATEDFSKTWEDKVREWGEYLRGAREEEMSWVNTFREYEERELANEWLQEDEERIALIDGPVLTQNLLSQVTARDLLEEMIDTRRVIGFIKDLSANPLLVAIGCALEPGEAVRAYQLVKSSQCGDFAVVRRQSRLGLRDRQGMWFAPSTSSTGRRMVSSA